MSALDEVMGVQEAGERWGLSPGYVKNLCEEKKVLARKIGKTWILAKEQPSPSPRTLDAILQTHVFECKKGHTKAIEARGVVEFVQCPECGLQMKRVKFIEKRLDL